MQKHISESELKGIISESVRKILFENNFGSQLNRIRARYYIDAKKRGLSGEDADKYVKEQMSNFLAKQAALTDFSKDLRKEHPLTGDYDEDEFYTHSRDLADTWGFEIDPYPDDEEVLTEGMSVALEDAYEEITPYEIFQEFLDDQQNGIKVKQWQQIPAQQYYNLLQRYMSAGNFARIPEYPVRNWMKLVIRNSVMLEQLTNIAGHSQWVPYDDFEDVFGGEYEGEYGEEYDYSTYCDFLDKKGFWDWCKLPDGTDAWSDYGLKPIFDIIKQYDDIKTTPEETLLLINRCLDIYHCRGDLASCFIQGGSKTCSKITNGEPLFEEKIEITETDIKNMVSEAVERILNKLK